MQSWPAPELPALAQEFGPGPDLRLFDTATGEVRPTAPGRIARMYVCGITPYDATHLGHAFTYVSFDTINRVWRDGGHEVDYVQNVTDIDDPLLQRAVETGQDWEQIAARETELFREDMAALRVLPPREYVGAVEAIPAVAARVERLRELGAVYSVGDDLYFSVAADPRFGSVAGLDRVEMIELFAQRGGDPDRPGKRDPLDCLVWQAARPGEPSWHTSLGDGRPGWHIECVAIALDNLGMNFDIQGGGRDLAFPHHEMCASEGQVEMGEWPFARHYVHTGMVGLDGHKMSKSRGNLVFVSVLRRAGADPRAIRLALLDRHYREDWEWTDACLEQATQRLARWTEAAARPAGARAVDLLDRIRGHLADDLQTPRAIAAIDDWAEQSVRDRSDGDAPRVVALAADALLGVKLLAP